ncbi:MAG: hypothetical protein B1H04_00885 [Planctomycetales bacterium 4484_123]|nr:MAG: hypothetical protein B1H04_00885 [Planctomycetales bacterium 4484_123]
MKGVKLTVAVALAVGWLWVPAWAEEGRRRGGELRGLFVRRAERRIGQRQHLAIVLRPLEGDEHVTLLVPRGRYADIARKLPEGQKVEAAFVVEDGQRWLTVLEVVRPRERRQEGRREACRGAERPSRGESAELRALIRRFQESIERLARQVKELRAETARLRRELAERGMVTKKPGRRGEKD